MGLCPTIEDREHDKFTTNQNDETCVRVCGESIPTGLQNGGLITITVLNATTWTALPLSALPNRNAISIQNQSAIELKINYSDSVVGYVGIIIPAGGERFYNVTEDIVLYAKSQSGTPSVAVEEIS